MSLRRLRLPIRTVAHVVCALALTMGAGAAGASASGKSLTGDCVAGRMQAHYTAAEYRDALANLPDDVAEYTPCRDLIEAAQQRDALAAGSAGTASRGGSGAARGAGAKSFGAAPSTGAAAAGDDSAQHDAAAAQSAPSAAEDGSPMGGGAAGASTTEDLGAKNVPVALRLSAAKASGESGMHAPMLPVVALFVIVVLGITRALVVWGRRPERISGPAA